VRMELQENILQAKIKIYHTNASISISVAQHNMDKIASLRPYDFYKGHLSFS